MLQTDRWSTKASRALSTVTDTPAFNLTVFALLLNFAWEILQSPFYVGMADMPHAQVTQACLQATVGDAVIMLFGYGVVAVAAKSRGWIVAATGWQLLLFVAVGVVITACIEWLAVSGYWLVSWTYAPSMPLVPGTRIGLVPLLQWVVLPLLTVWFVRRQLARPAPTFAHQAVTAAKST